MVKSFLVLFFKKELLSWRYGIPSKSGYGQLCRACRRCGSDARDASAALDISSRWDRIQKSPPRSTDRTYGVISISAEFGLSVPLGAMVVMM
jgi:hypothetical protein